METESSEALGVAIHEEISLLETVSTRILHNTYILQKHVRLRSNSDVNTFQHRATPSSSSGTRCWDPGEIIYLSKAAQPRQAMADTL